MSQTNSSIDAQEWVVQFDGEIKHTITKISSDSDSDSDSSNIKDKNQDID